MLKIEEIKNKETWENFLLKCKEKTFLNSWSWGEFQEKMKNKIFRLGVFENDELMAVALAVRIIAKRGTYFLIQHGPNIKNLYKAELSSYRQESRIPRPSRQKRDSGLGKNQVLNLLLEELKKIAREEKCGFIRIVPLLERNKENIEIFRNLGFRESPMHASAYESTWKLDITFSEEKLLENMRKTTRYLIRRASRDKDIQILKSEKLEDIEIYQKLTQEVAKRQKFIPFSYNFMKNEFDIFSKEKQALLIFGKYQNEIVGGALIIFWSGIGFYHQAASRKKYSKFSIPYLIQWEAIKEAKKRGCVLYDFWGYVDPFRNPRHPWAGPTLFKMGFSGYKKEYVKTQDFPLSPFYWLTYLFEKMRKIKRGL